MKRMELHRTAANKPAERRMPTLENLVEEQEISFEEVWETAKLALE